MAQHGRINVGHRRENTLPRIFAFTSEPQDWQALLADPVKHWETGKSARTLAYSWEAQNGFPPEVADSFAQCDDEPLKNITPILAVPEFTVSLPGRGHPSQNDIFVLARSSSGPVSIMVEGKFEESFDRTLDGSRKPDSSPNSGKNKRLSFLRRTLGITTVPPGSVRSQLLHRAASAVITGKQYRAVASVVLIHSFSQERIGWSDYQVFTRLFGVEAEEGRVHRLNGNLKVPLYGVWVVGNPFFLQS